ncbi:MAG: ABC transporter permease [Alphaproteobacteria bacterium]
MIALIVRRIGLTLLTMLVVSILLFLIFELRVDQVALKVLGPYSSLEQRQIWLENNGYFDPLWQRYLRWLGGALVGDFGESVQFKRPVNEVLWPRLGNTALLGAVAMAVIIPLSLALGVLAGMREGSVRDRAISVTAIVTTSIPEFASAMFLIAIFAVALDNVLPGTTSMADGISARELVLPALVLILYDFGYVARMTRASMAEVMTTHYIRTAVLKGLPRNRIIIKHALRNALIPPFTVIMLQFNWLLSGVIVVEVAFAYKGFGYLLFEAAKNDDLYVIQACTMVAVLVAVATQTISDIGYGFLNPRIRFG